MELEHVLGIQVLFLGGITAGHNSLNMDSATLHKYLLFLARYTIYFLASQSLELACGTVYTAFQTRQLPALQWKDKYKKTMYAFGACVAVLMVHQNLELEVEAVLVMIAYSGVRYLEAKRRSATITYGEGMACSFSEGYLYQVIASDGAKFYGLEDQIQALEAGQRMVFPVRRLLIVVTKSLFCPPNLEHFNKADKSLPYLEVCRVSEMNKSLGDVVKAVAGVKDRVYRNTVYKILRGADDPRPVHVVAECATPLHTLFKVLQRRAVYQRLANADGDEITREFCETLPRIVANSPELRDKVDLVFYNDLDKNENLAEVLLDKVREIEPNYETINRKEKSLLD